MDQHALGNFENKSRWRNATLRQCRADHVDDGPIAHLERRKIDRDIEIVGLLTRILQGSVKDESTDCIHQPHLFGDRNECRRLDRAARGVCPAQQGLDSDHPSTLRRYDRLVVHFQLVGADRSRQFAMDELLIV